MKESTVQTSNLPKYVKDVKFLNILFSWQKKSSHFNTPPLHFGHHNGSISVSSIMYYHRLCVLKQYGFILQLFT